MIEDNACSCESKIGSILPYSDAGVCALWDRVKSLLGPDGKWLSEPKVGSDELFLNLLKR